MSKTLRNPIHESILATSGLQAVITCLGTQIEMGGAIAPDQMLGLTHLINDHLEKIALTLIEISDQEA